MNYDELYTAYQELLSEAEGLRDENPPQAIEVVSDTQTSVHEKSKPSEKIKLFMSLFRGRNDVYAKRWTNKKGISGYSPACSNEWTQRSKLKSAPLSTLLYHALQTFVFLLARKKPI